MSIGSVSYAGYTQYTKYTASYAAKQASPDAAQSSFAGTVEKAQSASKTGKVTQSAVDTFKKRHPESAGHVDGQVKAGKRVLAKNGVENVSREDMTMEEYKMFFTALMDSIPFNASHQGDVEIWSISERGWEQMKNDPEYEAWVLGYTSENRAVYNPFASWPGYSPNICTEKFGDSIEQHIGQSVPTNSGSSKKTDGSDEESWWVRRHKKLKELIELQEKAAREQAAVNRRIEQENLFEEQAASAAYLNMMDLFGGGLKIKDIKNP